MSDLSNRLALLRDRIAANLKINAAWPERTHQICLDLVEARDQFKDHADFGKWLDDGGIKMSHQERAAAISMGREPERLLTLLRATKRRSLRLIHSREWAFTTDGKSPSAETKPQKPFKLTPETKKALDAYDRQKAAGEKPTLVTVAAEAGTSDIPARRAALIRRLEETIGDQEEIQLSLSAKEKLAAAIRAHKRQLDLEFDFRVQQGVIKWRDEHGIPSYLKKLDEIEKMLKWGTGVMPKAEYNTIMRCLHPDGIKSRTEEQMAEAFRLFTHYKLRLIKEEEERKKTFHGIEIPRTVEELLARKAQIDAERRAKRAAAKK